MTEQSELEVMLKLLMTLSNDLGYTAEHLAEKFDTNTRTIYKYIKTLKDAGFIVTNMEDKFRVDKKSPYYRDISRLLHFSEEEAFILGKAIHSIDNENIIKDNLVKKLYALYDFDRVAETIVKKENSENVFNIFEAIRNKKQVVLKNYQSANSSEISDRLVEPYDFTTNYISVWCFEPASHKVKLFKTSRIGSVEITGNDWQFEPKHIEYPIDVFRISSEQKIPVKLNLNLRAHNLLIEEYPLAEKYIKALEDNKFLFDGWVCSFQGVGRFILGLLDDIEVIEPQELKDFLNEKIFAKKF